MLFPHIGHVGPWSQDVFTICDSALLKKYITKARRNAKLVIIIPICLLFIIYLLGIGLFIYIFGNCLFFRWFYIVFVFFVVYV